MNIWLKNSTTPLSVCTCHVQLAASCRQTLLKTDAQRAWVGDKLVLDLIEYTISCLSWGKREAILFNYPRNHCPHQVLGKKAAKA